jgi:glycerophosphoryl diester phosphodiesterase
MPSQWECLLKNLGEWQGSFTRFSPQGEQLEDTPTVVSLEGLNDNQTIHQIVRRFPPEQPVEEKVLEYSSLSRSILLFENGAFSQGTIQWAPFSECGAELGLIEGDRRLRLVQLFNKDSQLSRITLIREQLAGTDTPERPELTLEQLLGEWHGEAVTIYPDMRSPDTYPTQLRLHREETNRVVQQLTYGTGTSARTITSTARVNGSILHFDQSRLPVQVLLLPDGASSNCPLAIKPGHFFVLEVGWLLQPDQRQRLVRTYSDKGEWSSLTLVKEQKVKAE